MKCRILKVLFLCVGGSLLYSATVHEVKKDETLYSISRIYGVSVDDIKTANGLSSNSLKVGQKIKIPENSVKSTTVASSSSKSDGTYTVQKGDTWYGISRSKNISLSELLSLNNATEKTALKVGQKIKVTAPAASSVAKTSSSSRQADEKGFYVVAKGDTLLGIARNFGLSYSEILAMNNMKESSTLKVGQKLKVAAPIPDLAANDPRNYSSKKGDTSLVWPVQATNVSYVNGKVNGVSLAAKSNESVNAVMNGTVMFAGCYRGFGNVVFIQSKTGHMYAYTGLGSVLAEKGQYVQAGGKIGTVGLDSYSNQPQISFMVFQNGNPIDPAKAPRG